MAWIEVHQELRFHRKVRTLQTILGVTRPEAIGHLVLLWMWSLDQTPEGDLSREGAAGIAEAAMWDRDPEAFVDGLRSAGFLDAWQLHDWENYAGRILEKRRARSVARQSQRQAKRVAAMSPRQVGDVAIPSPRLDALPEPDRTEPEEKHLSGDSASSAGADLSPSSDEGQEDSNDFADGTAGDVLHAEAEKAVDPLYDSALQVIQQFREDYHDNVDADYKFKLHVPAAEIKAAKSFLRDKDWPDTRLHELKVRVMLDDREPAPGKTWRGWATQVKSFAKLWEQRHELETTLVRGR